MPASRTDRASTCEALEGLGGFDQMVVFALAIRRNLVLPHVVGDLVPRLGCGYERLGIQFADTPGGKNGRLNAMRVKEFEKSPDPNAATELAFGKLHGGLVAEAPQEHGIKVEGQVHRYACAWRVGKVLEVKMPRLAALSSLTECLEVKFHLAGHNNVSFWLSAAHRNYGSGCLSGFSTSSRVCQYRNLFINYETEH
jgi:hypothetical protein